MAQHDMVVDNGTGAVVLADMQAALQALATCQSGAAPPLATYAGQFWLDTSVPPDGFLRQRNRDNTDWALVLGMPQQATDADIALRSPGRFLTPADVRTMQNAAFGYARNRIINGAMQISQENVAAAGTASDYHPADQWKMQFIGGAHSFQLVALMTPRGSPNRIRWTVTTAKPTLATGDWGVIIQLLEGVRVADFMYGTSAARRSILRFGFKGPAGTYSAGLVNSAGNRTYLAEFTISAGQANLDTEQLLLIPGDTTGTWLTDNGRGIQFRIGIASGTASIGVPGWQAGSMIGTGAMSNGFATLGNVFELFDVGLYLDLDGSGVPPPWSLPDYAHQLSLCQRYYVHAWSFYCGYNSGISGTFGVITGLPVEMRAVPGLSMVANLGQSAAFAASGTLTNLSSSWVGANKRFIREQRSHTATAESSALFSTQVACNARL